ncbi:MAG: hypothetical protein M3299_04755 [Thermoproteota archaeon]|nr:hypothetical protein [Thermoproteota archaeon]
MAVEGLGINLWENTETARMAVTHTKPPLIAFESVTRTNPSTTIIVFAA